MFADHHLRGGRVIRRVGGLEVNSGSLYSLNLVIRRVGGLEVLPRLRPFLSCVIRRVGGLEDVLQKRCDRADVIRRVGGNNAERRLIQVSRLSFGVIRRLRMVLRPAHCRRTCAVGRACLLR